MLVCFSLNVKNCRKCGRPLTRAHARDRRVGFLLCARPCAGPQGAPV
ncbi:DUF6011 domain-containing protein [Streptomyces sp. NPDC001194]